MPFASAATTAVQATSHSVLGHYFASLMGYTGFLVILGITLIWLIKRHPHKIAWLFPSLKQKLLADAQATASTPYAPAPLPTPTPAWGGNLGPAYSLNPALLHIEASVTLEAGQTLHVVQAQGQRMLVSSGVAGVQVLTQLSQQQPALEALSQATAPPAPPKAEATSPPARNPLANPTHYPTPPLPLGNRSTPTQQAPATPTPHPSRAFFETLRQTIPPQHLSLSATSPFQRETPRG